MSLLLELPIGWAISKIGEFLLVQRGGSPRPIKNFITDDPSGLNWIKIGDAAPGSKYITKTNERIIDAGLEKSRFVQEGDLLLSNSMSFGRPYILKISGCIHDGWLVLKQPENHYVEKEFLFHWLSTPQVFAQLNQLAKGSTVRNLNIDIVKDVSLRIPPLNEQRRIVAKLDALQARTRKARAALEAIPPLLERYRQSVLASAFRGDLTREWREQHQAELEPASVLLERIRVERRRRWEEAELETMRAKGKEPKDDKWIAKYKEPVPVDPTGLPDLPEGWCWAKLESVADAIDPTPSHRMPAATPDGVRYLSTENIVNDSEWNFGKGRKVHEDVLEAQKSRFTILPGDFVLSRIGTIGRTCELPLEREYGFSYALSIISLADLGIFPKYLQRLVSSDFVLSQAREGVQSVGVPDLGMAKIRGFVLPICSGGEQRQIVKLIAIHFKMLSAISRDTRQSYTELEKLNQSILAKAFRGELVPQDPNDEPAEVLLERIRQARAAAESEKKPKRKRAEKSKS